MTNGVNYAFQVRTRNGHGLRGESNVAIALAGNFGMRKLRERFA